MDLYLTLLINIYLKCIKDLNIRTETIKLLGENIEKKLDIGLGNDFLDKTKSTSNKS